MYESTADKWASKEVEIYIDNSQATFKPARKLMLAADPSSYCGQETMVGVVWAWELNKASYGPTQVIKGTQYLMHGEIDMSDYLRDLLRARKLERVKAYREWPSYMRVFG